jgi:signal transduction histidine kinase/ligand-binding sensor domain-containing protein
MFVAGKLLAQYSDNSIVLYSIGEANGLSDDHVQCVIKDKKGFVWVGTSDGLNMMDGSVVTIYRHRENDSTSIVNNNILCLAEDELGNIWIGTADGLSCYERDKNKFLSFQLPASPYGNAGFINSIYAEPKKKLWCSTDGGLIEFDVSSGSFHSFFNVFSKKNNSKCNKLTHLIKDKEENKLWLSSADGLWSFDLNSYKYNQEIDPAIPPDYQELFTYVYQSSDNKIWAGSWGNGLEQVDNHTGKLIHFTSLPMHPAIVRCIAEVQQPDGKNVLWLDGQLLAFDPSASRFIKFSVPSQGEELPDFFPCYKSEDGWIWLASSSGLFIYNPERQFFQHHFFSKDITEQAVVFSERNQSVLVGGDSNNFLKLYDDNWNVKKNFGPMCDLVAAEKNSGTTPAVLSITQSNTDLWLGTTSGIAKINTENGRAQWFHHTENDSTSLPRNFITHLFFDSDKKLWVFPWREGIWTLDTATGKCQELWDHFITTAGKPKKLVISGAAEDKNGNIWMADLDEGIILFDKKTGTFSKPFAGKIGNLVRTLSIFYKNGFLYSAIPDAFLKWDEKNRQLRIMELPQEMNKEIYDIYPDKKGNWWITTKNGLVVYNETTGAFRRFTTADGLLDNDMNGSLFCRNDGRMLFGNHNYITSFDPGKFLSAIAKVPAIQLTEILSNENPVPWNGSSSLQFSYRSRNIKFRWALPDFSSPLHNEYFCKLQGIDSGWHYVGNSGEVQYANLSPGKYTLQLKAASANGVVAPNIITIPFRLLEPFWKTTWFITLVCLVLISIFGIAVRYISQRNLKEKLLKLEKEQAVDKERNRISRDMHDDLGSGLTKIAILSEVVKKQLNDPEKAKQQLENISESSRELVDSLQDIIWVLNPKNDTLESLAAYIREYALKFFESFRIETHFIYPEKFPLIKLSEETRRNIFLTIKESFNNIGKHAWCDTVTLNIRITANNIEIIIKDDGKGFDVNHTREFGNGLMNMRNRIEQIGGTYEIQSEPGNGTESRIMITV